MEAKKQPYIAPCLIFEGILIVNAGSVVEGDPYHIELMDPLLADALGLDSPFEDSDR